MTAVQSRGVPADETQLRGTEAADRVADILLLFVKGPTTIGVSAIARELNLSKAVVHRVLQSLVAKHLIRRSPSGLGYRLGPGAAALGARALRDMDLRRVANPILERLRVQTNETATLTERVGSSRVYLDQFPSRQEVTMVVPLGTLHPLHAGASGKVILAFLPPDLREQIHAENLKPLTDDTLTDKRLLLADLAEIRRMGFSVSRGERQNGAASVAAPVFGYEGTVLGSISVCGPIGRFSPEAVAEHSTKVRAAAAAISTALGSDPHSAGDGEGRWSAEDQADPR